MKAFFVITVMKAKQKKWKISLESAVTIMYTNNSKSSKIFDFKKWNTFLNLHS